MITRVDERCGSLEALTTPIEFDFESAGSDRLIEGVEICLSEGHALKGMSLAVSSLGKLRLFFAAVLLDDSVHGRAADAEAARNFASVPTVEKP